ncbi:BCNT-domain-containing protein [Durotheca rogersii]|uniref:BCNT-domain-containing protein n=1 Tax=Durotheca rogersii TaxID=419775 RepID=UPI00221F1E2E|nr:BCNT-domain-containing protein [Durotheca rogersii]KAI5859402.1 BCNT-domain-containing protein [Durotheca rogersii]
MALEPDVDDEYASNDDSDFAPDVAPTDTVSEAEDSDDEPVDLIVPPTASPTRKRTTDEDVDENFENSGDEAIIQKGRKRQKGDKQRGGNADNTGKDDGRDIDLVRTRSMRAAEKAERKTPVVAGQVTIDVDSLWAEMISAPLLSSKQDIDTETENERAGKGDLPGPAAGPKKNQQGEAPREVEPPAMIKIKRAYTFAGKVHTEEKMVPRDSAEARLYLVSQDPNSAEDIDDDSQPKRKPRKAFRSAFEPVIEGLTPRLDLNLGMNARLQIREQAKAKKLNVVEKSRMDWAGFVDKEGIKDELELASKSKESYANRQDFLARVAANKEEEARRARISGRA